MFSGSLNPVTNRVYITERIASNIYGLLTKLQSGKLITRHQKQDIDRRSDNANKAAAILSMLPVGESTVFKKFLKCLQDTELQKPAILLRKGGGIIIIIYTIKF